MHTDLQPITTIIHQYSEIKQPHFSRQFKKLVITRFLTENVLIFLLQYIGLMFSVLVIPTSLLWFATGTACAFAFLRGYSILPGIWLGSVCAYYAAGASLILASLCAMIHVLQTFLLLWLSYRLIGPTLIFFHIKTFIKFILLSSILTAITSFILVSLCFTFTLQLFMQQWIANFNGILILATAIVTWDFYFPQISFKANQLLMLIYGILLGLILLLLFSQNLLFTILILFSIVLLNLFCSIRAGWCGAVLANFLFGCVLSFAFYLGSPLFATLHFLEFFLCLQTIVVLCVSPSRRDTSCRSSG